MSPTSIGVNLRVTGHCSQGGRKYMEDFFSVAYQQSEDQKDLEYAFFGIYDGHGGSEAATFAKEHLMNAIVNQKLFWSDCDQDVLRAIREGYIATHYAMWREQEKWPKTATGLPSTAGTTASVAFIRRGKIFIGHVGDSGIVLGHQETGEKYWRAKPLTHDHKPECNVEKTRIMNSGGKVVTKSGVPRVVWNRPRIGHKGPVRRSTPIDEIPFLAVARSLGDLWSYNSALNEFVVSPDPDVRVVKIDPKTFRCLIFGTDGLWNVLSPSDAMDLARDAETINERLGYMGGGLEWTNPSKCLVEKALEKWNSRKMRADNTSVVTIMLDPPGPPKREALMRNCTSASCSVDYIQMDGLAARSENSSSFPQNFPSMHNDNGNLALYGQSIRDHHHQTENSSQDTFDKYLPSSGYAVMTRYDNNYDSNYLYYGNHPEMMISSTASPSTTNTVVQQDSVVANSLTHEIQYMDSFAESYNSLLISSYASDDANAQNNICSDTGDNEACDIDMRNDYHSYQSLEETGLAGHDHVHHHQPNSYNQQQQHLYQQQCMSAEDGYSLTKLETRGEQQFNTIQSYRQQSNVSFQEFREEKSYSQYDISCSYQQPIIASPTRGPTISHTFDVPISVNDDKTGNNSIQLIAPQSVMNKYFEDSSYYAPNLVLSDESEKAWLEHTHEPSENRLNLDESIQINEISSSMIETSPSTIMTEEDDFDKSIDITKQNDDIQMTNIKPTTCISSKERSSKSDKSTSNKYKSNKYSIEQNENISVLERRQLRSSVDYNKRTLRSRNSLTKDMKTRSTKQQQQQQNNQLRRMAINHFSTGGPCTKLRSRQIQQQHITIWQPKQNRKSTTKLQQTPGAQCDTVTSKSNLKLKQSVVCSKPKTSVSINSNKLQSKTLSSSTSSSSLSQSCVATSSSVSSTTMSKRSTSSRNSAWCPGKTAVQTRNRVQKRLSH